MTRFCASSWLITRITLRCTVIKTAKKVYIYIIYPYLYTYINIIMTDWMTPHYKDHCVQKPIFICHLCKQLWTMLTHKIQGFRDVTTASWRIYCHGRKTDKWICLIRDTDKHITPSNDDGDCGIPREMPSFHEMTWLTARNYVRTFSKHILSLKL